METHENEQYVTFPLGSVHDAMHENIISHEEICEPVDECVLQDGLTEVSVGNAGANDIVKSQGTMEILHEQSDEEDDNETVYPMYIKEEEQQQQPQQQQQQQQYTSGDDESMAVEALRQLGGMYPCFDDKKLCCSTCKCLFTQEEMNKHQSTCSTKLSCTTCGERFERKIDLNNHMVCHQVDRPHACRTCGNLFRSKSSLQAHMMQVHQIERPHKCTICGLEFQRPSSLSNHMKIHTYVAGRAIMQSPGNNAVQSVEVLKKWPENESQNTQISSISSVQTLQNYDVCQVQWPVSYTFSSEQPTITMSNPQEKVETLQEFTVMPNGEVTQFTEYAAPSPVSNPVNNQNVNNQQFNLPLSSFNPDGIVKIETISYSDASQRNYSEVEVNDNKRQYTCKHCGMKFSRATALASHEKIHSTKNWNMPIECEYCDKQFQDNNHLATHQTNCTKKLMQHNLEKGVTNSKWGKHACSDCGKKFATKQKMFRHQWIHRKKTHSCEVCGSQFEKQNQLDEHRLSAHPGDSPFTCTECGKSFVSRQGLWEHGRTHAGSPAHFQCDTCSKTFSSRQGYLIHNRTHTGERPYGCKFCWKAFRDGGTLRKHERIHTGERPHVCPLCTRAFNQKVVLREHVRWVHAAGKNETEASNPPYPCPVCGALNQDRDELCAHIVKHSDQMIAEAKAKTNNDGSVKSKSKKKLKSSASCDVASSRKQDDLQQLISKTEQNEALLSITDTTDKSENMHVVNDRENNAFVVVTTEKRNDGFIAISELKHSSIRFIVEGKEDENVHVIQVDQNHRDLNMSDGTAHIVATESVDSTVLDGAIRQSDITTMLIQSPKQNNTLNIISRQNEALPVLTIPNPQNHEDYSSQIMQMSADMPMSVVTEEILLKEEQNDHVPDDQDVLMQEEASHVIQVVQYQHESDDCDDCICGICDETFEDKDTLKEHIKVHI